MGVVYRQPNSTQESNEKPNELLSLTKGKHCIMVGDSLRDIDWQGSTTRQEGLLLQYLDH